MKKKRLFVITRGYPANAEELSFLVQELEILKKYYNICIIPKYREQERDFSDCEFDIIPCINQFSIISKVRYLIQTLLDGRVWKEFQILSNKRMLSVGAIRHVISECYFSKHVERVLQRCIKGISMDEEVIFYSYWYDYSLLAMTKLRRNHDVIMTRLHGFDLYNERCSWGCQCFKEQLENKIDALVFISNYGKAYYETTFANGTTDYTKLKINNLGVRKQVFMPYQMHEKLKLISCSSLVPLKRVDKIIEALSKIDSICIEWTHIGDGSNKQNVLDQAKTMLNHKENIEYSFIGYLESEQVFEYYRNHYFDCFILLSDTEGLPVCIMEAMAFGIPVIASNVGGVSEIVNDTNGYLVEDTEDACAISNIMLDFHKLSSEEKTAMRESAYETWQEKFDSARNAEKLVMVIEEIGEISE